MQAQGQNQSVLSLSTSGLVGNSCSFNSSTSLPNTGVIASESCELQGQPHNVLFGWQPGPLVFETASDCFMGSPTKGAEASFFCSGPTRSLRSSLRQRTSQACEKCRERKTKCSGEKPMCDRCASRGLTCEYQAEKEGRPRGPAKARQRNSIAALNARYIEKADCTEPVLSQDKSFFSMPFTWTGAPAYVTYPRAPPSLPFPWPSQPSAATKPTAWEIFNDPNENFPYQGSTQFIQDFSSIMIDTTDILNLTPRPEASQEPQHAMFDETLGIPMPVIALDVDFLAPPAQVYETVSTTLMPAPETVDGFCDSLAKGLHLDFVGELSRVPSIASVSTPSCVSVLSSSLSACSSSCSSEASTPLTVPSDEYDLTFTAKRGDAFPGMYTDLFSPEEMRPMTEEEVEEFFKVFQHELEEASKELAEDETQNPLDPAIYTIDPKVMDILNSYIMPEQEVDQKTDNLENHLHTHL